MLEYLLVTTFGLLPLALSVLQLALLLTASHVLQLAAFSAVRAGTLEGGSRRVMQDELARGLAPLYARSSAGGQVSASDLSAAWQLARGRQALLGSLRVTNPTHEQFATLGIRRGAHLVIPNEAIEHRPLALQEANVLAIEVTHCLPLLVPFIDRALTTLLASIDEDRVHRQCYAQDSLPLRAEAHLPMQSDVRFDLLY